MAESKLKPCAWVGFCTTWTTLSPSSPKVDEPWVYAHCSPTEFTGEPGSETDQFFWRQVVPLSEAQRLEAEVQRLREDAERHKRAADILSSAMQVVREYPDFDEGGPLAEIMDMALRQEVHPALQFIVDVQDDAAIDAAIKGEKG